MQRLTAYFSGTVQGVGFRYTTVWESKRFDVTGYVKNLRDGRVELVAEGERPELLRFFERIQSRFKSHVRDVEHVLETPTGEFDGFDIRY